jgi:uncharacterized membrane protein
MRALLAVMILAALAAVPLSSADSQGEYYADLVFDVSNTGSVDVSGITNYPLFSEGTHDTYTSKKGEHWLLNISAGEVFTDYVYTVIMPPGSSINYIKASGSIHIRDSDRIMLEGVGSQEEFFIIVQYSINPPDHSLYMWSLAIPVLFAVLVFVRYRFRGRAAEARYDPSMLSERQLSIIRALEKNGKPMTQRQLEQSLGLPKSSVSRNISTLVKQGILAKHSRGMSNAVWFAENGNRE